MKVRPIYWFFFAITLLMFLRAAGAAVPPAGPSALKYKLIDQFGEPFFCDKDKWPVPRPEQPRAEEWFAHADLADPEFVAVSSHLQLVKPADHMQPEEILSLYQEHKKLQAITVEGSGNSFSFSIRTGKVGEQGEAISGIITADGQITVQKREPVSNTCPKCLAAGTRIDTPNGEVAVQDLRPGMMVWTADTEGKRIAAPVQSVVRVPVPANHEVVRMQLENGRTLYASPEHPTPDGRSIGELRPDDMLDGLQVLSAVRIRYTSDATYDVLPSGPTGYYWAEGVLLASTITR